MMRVSNKIIIVLSVLILIGIPSSYAVEIVHSYDEITIEQSTTSSTLIPINDLSLTSGNFTAGNKYLVIFQAEISGASSSDEFRIFATHGGTNWVESEFSAEVVSSTQYNPYVWIVVWEAVSSEDLTIEYRAVSGDTIRVDQASIIAIELSEELTEGVDWFYTETSGSDSLGTSWSNGIDSASITWTPNGSDDWLVMGNAQLDTTSTSINGESRLNMDNSTLTPLISNEGEDPSDKFNHFLMRVYTPTNAEHTVAIDSREDASSTYVRDYGRIFAINLDKFDIHSDSYIALDSSQDTNDTLTTSPTQENTATIDPGGSTDVFIMSFLINDAGFASATHEVRQQVANSDQPPTQTADDYIQPPMYDSTDQSYWAISTMESLSSSTVIDTDTSTFANRNLRDLQIVAFTMELAASGPTTHTIDVSEIEWIIDTDEVTLIEAFETHTIDVSEIEWIVDSQSVDLMGGAQIHTINVSEIEWIIDSENVTRSGSYIPSGKYIWFNISPASNSTLGGVFALDCGAGNYVQGILTNGTLICAALP